jgi:hypothetical protein
MNIINFVKSKTENLKKDTYFWTITLIPQGTITQYKTEKAARQHILMETMKTPNQIFRLSKVTVIFQNGRSTATIVKIN